MSMSEGYGGESFNEDPTEWFKEFQAEIFNSDFSKRTSLISRVAGVLSMVGSLYILQDILRSKKKRGTAPSRIMLGLSASDLLYSFFGSFLGPWVAPVGQAGGAVGSIASCTGSGALAGFGFYCTTLYNASLAICYLLIVRYNWKDDKLRRAQPFLLLLPVALVLPLFIVSVQWRAVNFSGGSCMFPVTYPVGCDGKYVRCERGARVGHIMSETPGLTILYAWHSIFAMPIVVSCMFLLYCSVRKQYQASARYHFQGILDAERSTARRHSRRVARQGILYVWAFIIPELSFVILLLFNIFGGSNSNNAAFRSFFYVASFLQPAQGLFNALVYLRPRYLEYRKKNPQLTCTKLFRTGIRQDSTSRKPESSKESQLCNSVMAVSSVVGIQKETPDLSIDRTRKPTLSVSFDLSPNIPSNFDC